MRKKQYQAPDRILDSCGGPTHETACPFFCVGHGYFCGHPYVEENRGKLGIPSVPSVRFYHGIPKWCPLPDFAQNEEKEEE